MSVLSSRKRKYGVRCAVLILKWHLRSWLVKFSTKWLIHAAFSLQGRVKKDLVYFCDVKETKLK